MFRIFAGAWALFNMFLCIIQFLTDRSIPEMIMESMFAIIFYLTFLFLEDDDEGYYI